VQIDGNIYIKIRNNPFINWYYLFYILGNTNSTCTGIFWLLYAILLFLSDKFGYRSFIFTEKHFDSLYKCNVRCSAVTTALIAFTIIMLPASDLSVGLLGIIFGISSFWAALNGLREFIKLQQQGISIKPFRRFRHGLD